MSEDRYTYPTEGQDPRTIDDEQTDGEVVAARQDERHVTHDQVAERSQGTSADAPGVDPSDREAEGGQPTTH
jgi:hypothetical protein